MIVLRTTAFDKWFRHLKDRVALALIAAAITCMEASDELVGDVKSVGEGVLEVRLHVGPGYRLYCARRGQQIVWLLAGGDKSTQARDIKKAQKLLKQIKEEER